MQTTTPPFRADEVGSLLRTAPLKDARAKRETGQITPAELKKIEDEEIKKVIRKQEEAGLQLATDGEFRRSWWHFDFFWHLHGMRAGGARPRHPIPWHPDQAREPARDRQARLPRRPSDARALQVPEGEYQGHAEDDHSLALGDALPRRAAGHRQRGLPRDGRLLRRPCQLYGKAIKAFYDAGCRYLQLDDTVWAYLRSKEQLEQARARGEDADKLAAIYARIINTALKSKPADMTITTHVCRGNFRSTWISEGGYEPVAELLLGGVDYDGFFLEYDTERAGGLEPLRFLPKGKKRVVVGLVTSKDGTLEKRDDIKRRLDEAAKYAPIEQLCLSPQCGFASTEEGNVLSEEQQWAKLKMIVDISKEVWE